jgi:transcriptional regulator with XRE-family HTH domain
MMNLEVGQRIKEARQKAGLTQEELGEAIEKNRLAIVRWEGGASFSTDLLNRIAKHLDVTPEWLMFGNQSVPAAITPELIELIAKAKRLVSKTVGFNVTELQALEWIATKAGVRNILFGDDKAASKDEHDEAVEVAEE